jgi:hypothetical protein
MDSSRFVIERRHLCAAKLMTNYEGFIASLARLYPFLVFEKVTTGRVS